MGTILSPAAGDIAGRWKSQNSSQWCPRPHLTCGITAAERASLTLFFRKKTNPLFTGEASDLLLCRSSCLLPLDVMAHSFFLSCSHEKLAVGITHL